jgi:hypothetical protein
MILYCHSRPDEIGVNSGGNPVAGKKGMSLRPSRYAQDKLRVAIPMTVLMQWLRLPRLPTAVGMARNDIIHTFIRQRR